MSSIQKLYKSGLLNLDHDFMRDTHYEVMTGSVAYNVSQDTSDMDVHAFCSPPVEYIYPHLAGHIRGFSDEPPIFNSFQQHGIVTNKKYDIVIYSITKFFNLAMVNNPNILDMLWVPDSCILSIDAIGKYVRSNRKHFLHKGSYHAFRGYSYAQLKKLKDSPRKDLVEQYGYDTKHAYHVVRLANQCQMILTEGDMDITRNAELLKGIRRGEWSFEHFMEKFHEKEKELDQLYISSKLQYEPDKKFIGQMLMACLEMKYGSLDKVSAQADNLAYRKLEQIRKIVNE